MSATPAPGLRRSFLKTLLLPALTFLLVPILAAGFGRYGQGRIDGMILDSIATQVGGDAALTAAEKGEIKAFYAARPPSAVCDDPDPEIARYRESVCRRWGETWQFQWATRLGLLAAGLGIATFLWIGALGLVAWRDRRAQYWSFMLGWRSLVAVTAVETVLQGVLLVWLSYWVTALLFGRYWFNLIIGVGFLSAAAVVSIVAALLKRVPEPEPLEAGAVGEADAPILWSRVRELAARLGTEPPRAIAAGIDDNFFVTERAETLSDGQRVEGRLLYVSLPLLRVLTPGEADAIFGHELAHFRGGDTAASARLAPMLVRYHQYWAALAGGGLTAPASHVMRLFRSIFELALAREQRRRELVADAEAARLTSPDDIGRSLLKVAGYSSFRARTERRLFEAREVHHEGLALRSRIDEGLPAHAASQAFLEEAGSLRVPHPFDSHPPLVERIAAVASKVGLGDAGRLLQERPAHTWADEVLTGHAIEDRLWSAYEARFQAQHQADLAWRYLPAGDEERVLVLRHFPDAEFEGKVGGVLKVTYAGLTLADGETVSFGEIVSAKVVDEVLAKELELTLRDAAGKKRTSKVKVRPRRDRWEAFKVTFSRYWQRDQVARKIAAERSSGQPA